MVAPIKPPNEIERIADLRAARILDTPRELRYDQIVKLACTIADTSMSYIALIDSDRQWLKAKCGLTFNQTGREESFCGHTILRDEPLIIQDATKDPRFQNNPLVTGEPYIRFYAGFPLAGPNGYNIGTLCIADTKPKSLNTQQQQVLRELAKLTEHELQMVDIISTQHELIETKRQLELTQKQLKQELDDAANYIKSLIPHPQTTAPIQFDWRYISSSILGGDLIGYHEVAPCKTAFYLLDVCGHGVSSSLLASTVFSTIRNQTLPHTDFTQPKRVLAALNKTFQMHRHQNKFFTIWYGVYNSAKHELTYAAGGHHPASLFNPDKSLTPLGEPNFMIGALPDEQFDPIQETVTLKPQSEILLFSDGAFEIRKNINGPFLGLEEFNKICLSNRSNNTCNLDAIIDTLKSYQGIPTFKDDLTLLKIFIS
ncbi:Phosphoserine phosphatase RsbP [Poriferisphaera corsica]|uniref:Phosphoserine phosphatase RsbP n=1 Tax=Poriferisphaera corsica TaxID=2528020 RepID=A0A517YQH6_9BACT|nr:SpoIIE family protein phosphatase [Poriferisphaera corsica]QDU32478.1 Phosphoserine phosphatase RsbP [Poriferisphaera corsica]